MQNPDETLEQFVTELKLLVKDCEYDKSDEMVRDRIVTGVGNSKIRAKLLNERSTLTLTRTLEVARTHELSHSQCSAMEDKTVDAVKQKNKQKYGKADNQKTSSKTEKNLVVNAVMSTENYNVPHMENAVPSANVLIISRKCVELHNQTVTDQRKNMYTLLKIPVTVVTMSFMLE